MGDEVLMSTKQLNVIVDKKLVPHFVGPFSIVQRVGPLDYQVNLGISYRQVHPIFHISILRPFCASGDGYQYLTAVYIEDAQEWEVSGIL